MRLTMILMLSAIGVVLSTNSAVAGGTVSVPEVTPASLSGGLALLAGGVLLARARWRK